MIDNQKLEGGLRTLGKFDRKSTVEKPLVSIVTVCRNSEKYIEETIKSVLTQSYDNIEYIIIDGCSTDKTIDIIKKYDNKIAYWLSESDRGAYDAMNKGVILANGEWVGIINSDDWYHTSAVEQIVCASQEQPYVDIVYGDLLHVRIDGGYVRREDCEDGKYFRRTGSHNNMLERWGLFHPTCFVKRRIYKEHKFNIKFKLSADYDFMLSLYFDDKKFFYISKPIAFFRPVGVSSTINYRSIFECFQIRKKHNVFLALKVLILETKMFLIAYIYDRKQKLKNFALNYH
ncbi:MAG: glycosyltransferase family 2 protein [Candidatus Omnitrophota bacterium]